MIWSTEWQVGFLTSCELQDLETGLSALLQRDITKWRLTRGSEVAPLFVWVWIILWMTFTDAIFWPIPPFLHSCKIDIFNWTIRCHHPWSLDWQLDIHAKERVIQQNMMEKGEGGFEKRLTHSGRDKDKQLRMLLVLVSYVKGRRRERVRFLKEVQLLEVRL